MRANVKKLLKEPSTWAGIAAVLVASFGFENLSVEQITVLLAGIAAVALPEKG